MLKSMKKLLFKLYLQNALKHGFNCRASAQSIDTSSIRITDRNDEIFGTYYLFNGIIYNYNHHQETWYLWHPVYE